MKLEKLIKRSFNNFKSKSEVRMCCPKLPGVYLVFDDDDDVCIYVGRSENVRKRILQHFSERGLPDKGHTFVVITTNFTMRDGEKAENYYERILINILQPECNEKKCANPWNLAIENSEFIKILKQCQTDSWEG